MPNQLSSTITILNDLNDHINKKLPFSLLRGGDSTLGVFSALFCPQLIKRGYWCIHRNQTNMQYSVIGMERIKYLTTLVGIPYDKIKVTFKETAKYMNEANYIDAFDEYCTSDFKHPEDFNLVSICRTIYKMSGINIKHKKFCSPRVNFYIAIRNEHPNLFDIMKDRRVFCISNSDIPGLRDESNATTIDYMVIPQKVGKRLKNNHLFLMKPKIDQLIVDKAKDYDLFLVGAGFLGRNFCGTIKQHGGRALDVGSLFDYWSGKRSEILFRGASRVIRYNKQLLSFERV